MSISAALREQVRQWSHYRCCYCLVHEDYVYATMEIEHIQPKSDNGSNEEINLCYACPRCNKFKHDISQGLDSQTQQLVPLYNPRTQVWHEHFAWDEDRATLMGLTACGRATINALKMNLPKSVDFRRFLVARGVYPPEEK